MLPPWASPSTSAPTRRPCPHARPRMPQRSPPVAMPPPWASLSTSALTRRPCPRVQTRTFLRSPPVAMPPLWAWPSTSFLSLCRDPRALSGRRPPVRAQMHSLQSSREAAPRRAQAAAPALRHRRTCLGCSWLCTLRVRLRARASCTRATPLRPARGVPLVPPPSAPSEHAHASPGWLRSSHTRARALSVTQPKPVVPRPVVGFSVAKSVRI